MQSLINIGKLFQLQAYFYQNIVRNNRHNHDALLSSSHAYHPASYTLGVKGVQKFNITDNIFGNQGIYANQQ